MQVSFALIVRNEEAKLAACIESIAGIAGEIIVVDTGSTDRTKPVAASLGAKVFDFPWIDDFAAARNECLRHASGDYIFWLDADEVIDEANRDKLRILIHEGTRRDTNKEKKITTESTGNTEKEIIHEGTRRDTNNATDRSALSTQHSALAYAMKCRCLPDPHSGIATVVDHIRLFPNHPQIRWKYRVHEQVLPALNQLGIPIVGTDIVIDHTGYQDPAVVRRKTERNLRLLELDYADHPEDPFILFNLGWTYLTLNQAAKALGFLRESLERSNPGDSIVRKIHGLIAQAHLQMGQPGDALAACRAGRARYPDDEELLLMQGRLLEGAGNLAGAERCYRQLVRGPWSVVGRKDMDPRINTNGRESESPAEPLQSMARQEPRPPEEPHPPSPRFSPVRFVSVEEGLRGYKARFHLGMVYRRQGRDKEAEEQFQAVLAERPDFTPAALELARLYLCQQRWPEFDAVVDRLTKEENDPQRDTKGHEQEAGVLKARGLLARKEFAAARQILEPIIERQSHWPYPRVILSYVFLQSEDVNQAERVLRDLLVLDPSQYEAWLNLARLLRNQRRIPEAVAACRAGRVHCPDDPDMTWLHGTLLFEAGDLIGAEACFLAVIGRAEAAEGNEKARERVVSSRHHLALIYRELRRPYDAEVQWRAALAEDSDYPPALVGWKELDGQHGELASFLDGLRQIPVTVRGTAGGEAVPLP